ncbi:MAG: hypothetical protein OXU34_07285 [Gammaproteobacteria bacterium]|nr:hypothetical protein [Gammaproteobacteria bacterium]
MTTARLRTKGVSASLSFATSSLHEESPLTGNSDESIIFHRKRIKSSPEFNELQSTTNQGDKAISSGTVSVTASPIFMINCRPLQITTP